MVHGNLDRGVPDEEISTYDVSLNSDRHKESVRIAQNGILLNHIVISASTLDSYPEIVPLNQVSISA